MARAKAAQTARDMDGGQGRARSVRGATAPAARGGPRP